MMMIDASGLINGVVASKAGEMLVMYTKRFVGYCCWREAKRQVGRYCIPRREKKMKKKIKSFALDDTRKRPERKMGNQLAQRRIVAGQWSRKLTGLGGGGAGTE